AYPEGSRGTNSDWPKVGSFPIGGVPYDYVQINLETIKVTGPSEKFDAQLGPMPHLTCCCAAFDTGFDPDWGSDKTQPPKRKSAFVQVNNGKYTTKLQPTQPGEDCAKPGASCPVTTVLLLDDPADITFTGTLGGSTKTLKIKAGSRIIVANEPRCVLEGT